MYSQENETLFSSYYIQSIYDKKRHIRFVRVLTINRGGGRGI